jgi:hypothetical protein
MCAWHRPGNPATYYWMNHALGRSIDARSLTPALPQLLAFLEAFRDKTLKRISDTDQAVNDLVFEVKVRPQIIRGPRAPDFTHLLPCRPPMWGYRTRSMDLICCRTANSLRTCACKQLRAI